MTVFLRTALLAAAALVLAGCYVTGKTLITPANAAWPFKPGTAFTTWSWKEETNAWEQSGSGTIQRVGDRYRLHPNPEPGETADPDDDMDFLLSDLGEGYFAAEAQDKEDEGILLDVIKVEGDTVFEYVLMCEAADKTLADQGIIEKYEHGEYTDTCTVGSLDQLERAFRAKLAAGMIPHAKYQITR